MTPRRWAFVVGISRHKHIGGLDMDRKDRYGHETGGEARTVALILAATAAAVGISLLCGV